MYAYDPLSQEQMYVPEFQDKYNEIAERTRRYDRRVSTVAWTVVGTFAILLFVVAVKHLAGPH